MIRGCYSHHDQIEPTWDEYWIEDPSIMTVWYHITTPSRLIPSVVPHLLVWSTPPVCVCVCVSILLSGSPWRCKYRSRRAQCCAVLPACLSVCLCLSENVWLFTGSQLLGEVVVELTKWVRERRGVRRGYGTTEDAVRRCRIAVLQIYGRFRYTRHYCSKQRSHRKGFNVVCTYDKTYIAVPRSGWLRRAPSCLGRCLSPRPWACSKDARRPGVVPSPPPPPVRKKKKKTPKKFETSSW